jgi:ABC-type antimicrobial peptide transport system permease subunit
MARRGGEGGSGMGNPMNVIIGAFIGLLVLVSVVTLGPVLGDKLQTATGGQMSPTSEWNATYNTNLPAPSTIWSDNVSLGMLCVLVCFIALALYYIRMVG